MYLLREAPYRCLSPQMAAIIHHGGVGTTAEALLAGVPNAVVAFGVDQPTTGAASTTWTQAQLRSNGPSSPLTAWPSSSPQ